MTNTNELNKSVINTIIQGDTIEEMRKLDDKSVDMILADLPYGTTACKWDTIIPFEPLWAEYERVIKKDGAIVLTSSASFTNRLINSIPNLYKYKWIWIKSRKGNFINANNRPMTQFEEVLIFSKGGTANGSKVKVKYNPQGLIKINKKIKKNETKFGGGVGKRPSNKEVVYQKYTNYPTDILCFSSEGITVHPTQKPVALFEYLIRTYTNEGDVVLDNVIGSGTTAVAAINTGRNFIGIEREQEYVDISRRRINEAYTESQTE